MPRTAKGRTNDLVPRNIVHASREDRAPCAWAGRGRLAAPLGALHARPPPVRHLERRRAQRRRHRAAGARQARGRAPLRTAISSKYIPITINSALILFSVIGQSSLLIL